jgi:cytochrome b involved in lipid metabolism
MVLDIIRFKMNHPGGKFVLEQNIGRDISKFFYGGYTMENDKLVKPQKHSNIARKVVNTLIIGKLERSVPKFECKIVESV